MTCVCDGHTLLHHGCQCPKVDIHVIISIHWDDNSRKRFECFVNHIAVSKDLVREHINELGRKGPYFEFSQTVLPINERTRYFKHTGKDVWGGQVAKLYPGDKFVRLHHKNHTDSTWDKSLIDGFIAQGHWKELFDRNFQITANGRLHNVIVTLQPGKHRLYHSIMVNNEQVNYIWPANSIVRNIETGYWKEVTNEM